MSLFDFLKRKKQTEKAKEKKQEKVENKPVKTSVSSKTKKESKIQEDPYKKGGEKKFSYEIVKEPHISEKSTLLAEKNQYVFKVSQQANKPEIKKSVEGIYGVDVLDVNVIKIPSKKRRLGRTQGFKKGYRKAIVTVKEGQKIEIL